MSHTEVFSEKKISHVDYRNMRLISLLLITARLLREVTSESKERSGNAVLGFIHDSVASYGNGETLRIEAYELSREMGIQINECEWSEISKEVH